MRRRAANWREVLLFTVAMTGVMAAQEQTPISLVPASAAVQERPPAWRIRQDGAPAYQLPPGEDPQNRIGWPFLQHLAGDQKTFWTSPSRAQKKDLPLLLPFFAIAAGTVASDSWLAKQVPDRPDQLQRSRDVSNYAVWSLVGATGGSLLFGQIKGNDHLREAGLLSGEAALGGLAANFALKNISQRPRPLEANGHGSFFRGGSSFPSQHSAVAWAMASVWAHEYPGPLSKFLSYGLASAVTLTRVTSKEHFASDALIGSALGWFIGRQVYRAHHDPELGGTAWGDLFEMREPGPRNPTNMASPYVPVDSWVYPVFDRLAALGYVQSAHAGMRPWTRLECARLVEEADEGLRYRSGERDEARQLVESLAAEFADETGRLNGAANVGAGIDSIYSRSMVISGTPLRDGYHFGQTIINDYGRPYGEGYNNVTGVTAHAVGGPFAVYLRGEYQHAPAVPSDPPSVSAATALPDGTLPLPNGSSGIDRLRLLEGSVAFTFHNTQISFGKQSLWLGPGSGGPFLFSNNAEPIPMLRIDQVSPRWIPGISRILGPMRTEFFLGQLSGHRWIFSDETLLGPTIDSQPFIHGQKISFKPTSNLEFGFGLTTVFGGEGLPFTWDNFLRTFFSHGIPGTSSDPGDRRSTFDFSYRVPYIRDYLTMYADSFVEDEVSPLGSTRPSMRLGMFVPKLPRLPKLELRMEGVYTDVPGQKAGAGFIYSNGRYRSGYTNNGNLLASWIGRYGRGGQGWATYWFSPRNKLQFAFRGTVVDKLFVGGGQSTDVGLNFNFRLRPDLALTGGLQYEKWMFPVLRPTGQANVTASFQLTFFPKWHAGQHQ